MSYHYLVVKDFDRNEQTKPHYSLITIGKGTSLEEIDFFTTTFTKEKFKEYLRNLGVDIYEKGVKQQVFIASPGKGGVRYRDVIYDDAAVHELARKELSGETINNQDVCNNVSKKAIEDENFRKLFIAGFFDIYEEIKERILDAINKKTGRVSFVGDSWLQDNYLVGRDCLCSFHEYEKSRDFIERKSLSALLQRKSDFNDDRKSLHEELKMIIKEGANQHSLFTSPEGLFQIDNQESIEAINKEEQKVILEEKDELGEIEKDIKSGLPLEVLTDTPDPTCLQKVVGLIINLNYYYSEEDSEYYADFNEWAEKRAISLTEDDCHILNRLLSKKLRQKAALANLHANHIKEYYSPGEAEDVDSYRREIKNILKKSCLAETNEYKNAYNLFLLLNELTKDKDDNYGKQH